MGRFVLIIVAVWFVLNLNTNVGTPAGVYDPTAPGEDQYERLFVASGQRHGVDPALLAGVAQVESTFNPDAVSPAGAVGLMQFMPATAAAMGVNPRDEASAIDGAARYLASSYGLHGSWDEAIAAYNAGDPAVTRRGVVAADGSYVADVRRAWAARTKPGREVLGEEQQ